MIQNFFKVALRNMFRHKLHSFINVFGLAIGLSATFLIASYVYFELSYDQYNKNYSEIYRLYSNIALPNGAGVEGPVTLGTVAPTIKDRIPEVGAISRIYANRNPEVEYNGQIFSNNELMWVDSSFFDIFTLHFIAGNPSTALTQPNTIVITDEYAKRLFGDADAFNQSIRFWDENYKITGIVEKVPLSSHFYFDMLGSFITVTTEKNDITKQSGFNFYTYLICNKNVDKVQVEAKLDELIKEEANERFKSLGLTIKTVLQPLGDIHLKSHTSMEIEDGGDINNVYIFSVLCIFIIIIAIVNFVNLVTANSETRAKEIGLRKVMGAYKSNLFRQFIGESIIVSFISFILALGLTELLINPFRQLMDSPIIIPYWSDPMVLVLMITGVFFLGVLSGVYPAFYLAGFLPIKALKGGKSSTHKNSLLRKVLVVFQFAIAIFLLVNLALLYTQVNFLKNKDLGFNKDQVMVVNKLTSTIHNSYKSIKAELEANPNVVSVAASQFVPGKNQNVEALFKLGEDASSSIVFNIGRIQTGFLNTYGMEIIEGRDFSDEMKTDYDKLLINETTVKKLGLEHPIDQKLVVTFDTMQVIGVFRDFNYLSLHNAIEPFGYALNNSEISYISIKLQSKDLSKTIQDIEQIFQKLDPNYTFSYQFIDQYFSNMYEKEEKVNELITYAAVLSIIISMLGLFALTSYTIQQRIREIGIRKVMGASEGSIVKMFIYDLSKWVLIAAVLAFPLSYYAMDKWLDKFVYRTDIALWMFASGAILALFIATITVGIITIKAARANPSESLKYE